MCSILHISVYLLLMLNEKCSSSAILVKVTLICAMGFVLIFFYDLEYHQKEDSLIGALCSKCKMCLLILFYFFFGRA